MKNREKHLPLGKKSEKNLAPTLGHLSQGAVSIPGTSGHAVRRARSRSSSNHTAAANARTRSSACVSAAVRRRLARVGGDGLVGADDLVGGADCWVDDEDDEVDADLFDDEEEEGAVMSASVGTDM